MSKEDSNKRKKRPCLRPTISSMCDEWKKFHHNDRQKLNQHSTHKEQKKEKGAKNIPRMVVVARL